MRLGELIEIFQVEPEGEPFLEPQLIPAEEEPADVPNSPAEPKRSSPVAVPAYET